MSDLCAVIAWAENEIHSLAVVEREEAHRLLANGQRVDDEIVALGGMEPMRFGLVNVDSPSKFLEVIATEAPPQPNPG